MRTTVLLALVLAPIAASAQYPGAKRVPNDWKRGFDSIKEARAKEILGFLAGKELRGRGSLTPDFYAAAGYVANELRTMGLEPAGENGSYFQRFDYIRATAIPADTTLESADGSIKLTYGSDFQASALVDGETRLRLAFIHVPANADMSGFAWNELKDRVVIQTPTSLRNAAYADKINNQREALGIRQVVTVASAQMRGTTGLAMSGVKDMPDPRQGEGFTLRLSPAGADSIATKLGALQFVAKKDTPASIETPPQEFVLKTKVTAQISPLVNVLAKLPGRDPSLAKETVALGSHLDHMGVSQDGIRNGADDNASGCTANLMIARAFVGNRVKPKRTMLFAFWAAEEVGTWGSYAYVSKPTIPMQNIVAYINMDMLGRDEDTGPEIAENNWNVVYPGTVLTTSRQFYDRLVAANDFVKLRFKPDRTDRTHRSDTRNFYWKEVPTVKIFTGEHPDYHRTGDTIDKINWTKLVNISKWLYLAAADLGTSFDRPTWDPKPFVAPDFHILAGRATYKEKVALPDKAVLRLSLYEAGSEKPLLTKEFPNAQGRTPFELLVPKSQLKDGAKYELRAEMRDRNKTLFSSATPVEVPTTGWTRAREIELTMTSGRT